MKIGGKRVTDSLNKFIMTVFVEEPRPDRVNSPVQCSSVPDVLPLVFEPILTNLSYSSMKGFTFQRLNNLGHDKSYNFKSTTG